MISALWSLFSARFSMDSCEHLPVLWATKWRWVNTYYYIFGNRSKLKTYYYRIFGNGHALTSWLWLRVPSGPTGPWLIATWHPEEISGCGREDSLLTLGDGRALRWEGPGRSDSIHLLLRISCPYKKGGFPTQGYHKSSIEFLYVFIMFVSEPMVTWGTPSFGKPQISLVDPSGTSWTYVPFWLGSLWAKLLEWSVFMLGILFVIVIGQLVWRMHEK